METYYENKMELNYLNEYDGLKIGDRITYTKRYNPVAEECLKAYLKTLNLKIAYAKSEQSNQGIIVFITGPYRNRDLHRFFYRLHVFNPVEKDLQNLDMYADERLKIWDIKKIDDTSENDYKNIYEFIKYLVDQEMNLLEIFINEHLCILEETYNNNLFSDIKKIICQITDITKYYLDYLNMNNHDQLSLKYTLINGIHRINSVCKNKIDECYMLHAYDVIQMIHTLYFNIQFYMPIYKL